MSIYLKDKNVALLKKDRSVVELYKGSRKIFGYKSAKGEVVRANDVHPVEHKMKISLRSKNLLPYPYADTTKTVNGITFTDNGDGTITANGTATELADFTLSNSFLVKKGMGISGAPKGSSYQSFEIQAYLNSQQYISTSSDDYEISKIDFDYRVPIRIRIRKGFIAENMVFEPQIEYSEIATRYTPYVANLKDIAVKRYGKNLLKYPYNESSKTVNGITFTNNGDGTVTVDGKATAQSDFLFFYQSNTIFTKKGIPYCFSGCPEGGSNSMRILASVKFPDGTVEYYNDKGNGYVMNLEQDAEIIDLRIRIGSGQSVSNLVFKPQVEIGSTPTEYKRYIEPQTSISDVSGTVEGITSLPSDMTILTDTDGVDVNCDYA